MKHQAVAEQCWADSLTKPSLLELLATPRQPAQALYEDYVNGCLMDLQLAMDRAWEAGEVGLAGAQLAFIWERKDAEATSKAA